MGSKTGIAWTESTWNPIRGCSRVSEGCRNCYAETVAHRFSGPGQTYEGLTTKDGRWNGTVRFVEKHLTDPLRWQKPRLVFVNSMSDLFHESLADADIDRIVAVMALSPRHTFQVLTKRPQRMRDYLAGVQPERLEEAAHGLPVLTWNDLRNYRWPLLNVWWGTSAEDQETWDARVSQLPGLRHAQVNWVSVEPQLAEITPRPSDALRVDWLVIGGESGAGARPFDVAWARKWIAWGQEFGVPVFIKQLGCRPYDSLLAWRGVADEATVQSMGAFSRKGKWDDPAGWTEDIRVREYPKYGRVNRLT